MAGGAMGHCQFLDRRAHHFTDFDRALRVGVRQQRQLAVILLGLQVKLDLLPQIDDHQMT
jgi:hypothetical protein